MALYLVDKLYGDNGLALASADSEAKVVLLQDGVYLDTGKVSGAELYALTEDVENRGLQNVVTASVKRIDYGELVDLIVANKVYNFA
jgi:tRNA 2-thiouridine synthesizing protein B